MFLVLVSVVVCSRVVMIVLCLMSVMLLLVWMIWEECSGIVGVLSLILFFC